MENRKLCKSHVESYCATGTSSSATVPLGQYPKYDGTISKTICSVNPNLANHNEDGWTTIFGTHKKNDQKDKETRKEDKCFHGKNESAAWDWSVVPRMDTIEYNQKVYLIFYMATNGNETAWMQYSMITTTTLTKKLAV